MHDTYEDAVEMAQKYADQNPTMTFMVLEVVSAWKSDKALLKQQSVKENK